MNKSTRSGLLTEIEVNSLVEIMNRKYASYLGDRFFSIDITNSGESLIVVCVLESLDQKFYYPVEAKIVPADQELNSRDAAMLVLDYIDMYFDEFFKSAEETLLYIDPAEYSFEGVSFTMKGQIYNRELEAKANALLGGE